MKDSRHAKLESEHEKLKKKKLVLQAHMKSASEIQSTETVCKTIIEFIQLKSKEDILLISPNDNPYVIPINPAPCPSCTIM